MSKRERRQEEDTGIQQADIEKALADLKLLDLAVDLYGSRAIEVAHRESDVNVLVSRPFPPLIREIQEAADSANPKFMLVEVVPTQLPDCLPPRLVLKHISTDVVLDVISRWSADIFVRQRDEVSGVMLAFDDRVRDFIRLLHDWVLHHRHDFPTAEGYPNMYVFRLIGFHFLMARVMGVVLPPLVAIGCKLNELDDSFVAQKKVKKDKASPEELLQDWLEALSKAEKRGLWANLKKPQETGPPSVWQVIDPPSGKKLLRLSESQIFEIASRARRDAAVLRGKAKPA